MLLDINDGDFNRNEPLPLSHGHGDHERAHATAHVEAAAGCRSNLARAIRQSGIRREMLAELAGTFVTVLLGTAVGNFFCFL